MAIAFLNRQSETDHRVDQYEVTQARQQRMRVRTEAVRRGLALDQVFEGKCSEDCSGHRAGYLWAIDQPAGADFDCRSANGASFREGCEMGAIARDYE